jgi:hypothetical protein
MKAKILLFALAVLLLASPLALADTFGPAGNNWTSLVGVPTGASPPFWDNPSNDGGPQNIGFKMLAQGLANPEYWSLGGAVDNNVFFNGVKSGQTETLLIEIAANSNINALYAYDITNIASTTLIFAGPVGNPPNPAPPVTVNVDIPYAQYGYLLIGAGNTKFYSGSGHGETSADANSNFAFFRDKNVLGTWWFGVEDLPDPINNELVGDYNDMIVKISTVPLPSSVLLLGSGMLGLLGLGWRRKTQVNSD